MGDSITACLIVQNEAARLEKALASVAFCNELVVVDGGSTDETVAIAERAGARVIRNPWPGFGAQRNRALDEATSDWVLELDADERVPPSLRAEIEDFLAAPPPDTDLVAIPIRHRFLGRLLGASARYPAYRYRLFRRAAYRHDESRTVHEGLWSAAVPRCFEHDLEHLLAESWREALTDTWRYARLEAKQSSVSGARAGVKELLLRPVVKVAYRTFVLEGWRDGLPGLTKIGLDAATDVIVAGHSVIGRDSRHAPSPRSAARPHGGPVRILALAPAVRAEAAAAWLEQAVATGADGVVVTDGAIDTPLRTRQLDVLRYRSVARAVDSENQLRAIDALLLADPRADRWVRRLPRALRGSIPPVSLYDRPEAVVATILANRPGDAV